MTTTCRGPPGGNIEILSPHRTVHPALLETREYEGKTFAGTFLACSATFLPEELLVVPCEEVSAEALGVPAQPEAL